MDRILLFGFLEELELLDKEAVDAVINEVKEEMFVPTSVQTGDAVAADVQPAAMTDEERAAYKPTQKLLTPNGNEVQDAEYYKAMLGELVDALDTAISHKIKLTQYIDKLLKKKYRAYVRLKDESGD